MSQRTRKLDPATAEALRAILPDDEARILAAYRRMTDEDDRQNAVEYMVELADALERGGPGYPTAVPVTPAEFNTIGELRRLPDAVQSQLHAAVGHLYESFTQFAMSRTGKTYTPDPDDPIASATGDPAPDATDAFAGPYRHVADVFNFTIQCADDGADRRQFQVGIWEYHPDTGTADCLDYVIVPCSPDELRHLADGVAQACRGAVGCGAAIATKLTPPSAEHGDDAAFRLADAKAAEHLAGAALASGTQERPYSVRLIRQFGHDAPKLIGECSAMVAPHRLEQFARDIEQLTVEYHGS